MIIVKNDTPGVFKGKNYIVPVEQGKAIDALAVAVTGKRNAIIAFLQKYNVQANVSNSRQQLLDKLLNLFKESKSAMNEFAGNMAKGAFSSVDGSGTDPYTQATQSIINGLGSILQLFSQPNTSEQAMQTNAQILQLAQEKENAARRNNIWAWTGISFLVLVSIFTIYMVNKKS